MVKMDIEEYEKELHRRELSDNTMKKYLRDVKKFIKYADGEITQEKFIEYKKDLIEKFKISTVNNKITIINNYLEFMKSDVKVKQEKQQTSNVLDNVLSETDYNRLVRMSETRNKPRTRIIMLSLYHTGVRVSELQFLTVEAVSKGEMDIYNKGKHRRVPIVNKLKKELLQYIKDEGITTGEIILNARGNSLSRSYIFKELKWIGGQARVKKDKVYPHSFRHLFAKQYLEHNNNDTFTLADILGHSSLDTTRIYVTKTTKEQRDSMDF